LVANSFRLYTGHSKISGDKRNQVIGVLRDMEDAEMIAFDHGSMVREASSGAKWRSGMVLDNS